MLGGKKVQRHKQGTFGQYGGYAKIRTLTTLYEKYLLRRLYTVLVEFYEQINVSHEVQFYGQRFFVLIPPTSTYRYTKPGIKTGVLHE